MCKAANVSVICEYTHTTASTTGSLKRGTSTAAIMKAPTATQSNTCHFCSCRRGRGWPCARWRRSRQRSLATLPRSSSRPSAPEPRTELVAAWPGLRAERLPPVPEDEVAALVQPICSRSAADPRAPARRRHWAGAPRLPPRLARAAGAGPGTSHVEVAPFLPFQEHRPRTAAYICCLRREREIGEIGVCRSATSRNIPLFYKFLSAAIRQAAECHTERDTIKASTFHSQFHPVPSLGARRQLQHEHDDAEQVRGRPRGADARIGGERSAAGHAHQEAAWRGPTLHGALGQAANVLAGDSAVRLERRVRPSAVLDVHVEVKG